MFFSRRVKSSTPSCIRRLLVVEDDALLAFDHEHVLLAAGYQVVATVNCGESAIAALEAGPVDAIILDLNLAGQLSGAEVAKHAYARGVIVLIVSAQDPAAVKHHATAHLAKPLAHGALVAALRAVETKHCRNEAPRRVAGLTMLAG